MARLAVFDSSLTGNCGIAFQESLDQQARAKSTKMAVFIADFSA
jgi:hypothetical protein